MLDLETYLIISLREEETFPVELAEELERNGWSPVRRNQLYVLSWTRLQEDRGGNGFDIVQTVERARETLSHVGIQHRFETVESSASRE